MSEKLVIFGLLEREESEDMKAIKKYLQVKKAEQGVKKNFIKYIKLDGVKSSERNSPPKV